MGVRLVAHNFLYDEANYTGTYNHDEMFHRDWLDQHPIYAISGLQEVLNTIEQNLIDITSNLIDQRSELIEYTDDKVNDLSDTINAKIDELNVLSRVTDTDTIDLDYTNRLLKADLKIYNDPNNSNLLQVTDNGLYAPNYLRKDTDTINWRDNSTNQTLTDLFIDCIRFSHNDLHTYNNLYDKNESDAWILNNNSLIQSLDTETYNGIVSKNFYDNFEYSVRISSDQEDNGANGIMLAFVFDEHDHPHTLSIMVQRGADIELNYRFAVIYNFRLPGQTLVTTYNLINSNSDWNDYPNGISFYATKNKNLITIAATRYGYDNTNTSINDAKVMPFECNISLDLDDYSWGYFFKEKVRYGCSNLSQANSVFDSMFFYSKDPFCPQELVANVKLHDDSNNALQVFHDGLFVKKFLISSDNENALEEHEDGYYVRKSAISISNERLNGLINKGDGAYFTHKSHSFIVAEQEDHGLEEGDFIYFDTRTSLYKKATAVDNFDINIIGMVDYVYDENKFEYICSGLVETDLFTEENGYAQGMPLYISTDEPGKVTQEQPDISKTVGYPIDNIGVIISIERGIQYSKETQIGDFKKSANDYSIRSDGFIKVAENIEYKLGLVQKLLLVLDQNFKDNYLIINEENNTLEFKNVAALYEAQNILEEDGINLFIKAF